MQDRISITVTDGVADVQLTRPEKKNAVDYKMFDALGKAAEHLHIGDAIGYSY